VKICSLLPSATEIVCALGLRDSLVAVTHECDFPPEVTQLPIVTRSTLGQHALGSGEIHAHISGALHRGSSIYAFDQELLQHLDPDLILTQELCDVCAVSYEVVKEAVHCLPGERTVLSLEPTTREGILQTIEQVGEATGTRARAAELIRTLRERIDQLAARASLAPSRPRVFAMEWLDPPFTAGHWVPEIVSLAGGRDDLAQNGKPSTQIQWADIERYDPEVIVLMPCGFTLGRTIEEFPRTSRPQSWERLAAVRTGRVYGVNGSAYFNRPGPRIVIGLQILTEILHPDLFPRSTPIHAWRQLDHV
jgi:iron complex transport system substrate-binding protein